MISSEVMQCKEAKIWELMAEMYKLKQENEQLKAERDEWKEGFKILHNMMEEQNNDGSLLNEYENGETETDFDAYAKEMNEMSLQGSDWKYEA